MLQQSLLRVCVWRGTQDYADLLVLRTLHFPVSFLSTCGGISFSLSACLLLEHLAASLGVLLICSYMQTDVESHHTYAAASLVEKYAS